MKKSYDSKFKSRVALEAPHVEGASEIFQTKAERKESKPYTEDDLMRKIGRLEIENDFLRSVSTSCGLNPEKLK